MATSKLAGVDEQHRAGRRRRRPVVVVVGGGGGIVVVVLVEVLDAPDVLVAGEAAPARDGGGGRVVGRDVGGDDGAGRVLAGDVVGVVAQGAEQGGARRAGHAETVEEVGAEGAEDVRDGGDAHPRRAAVERPERGERRAEQGGRAAHAEAHGAGGVPDAEHRERRREGRVRVALDGDEGAQRELVGEERRHVGGQELRGLRREQARVGRGRQRRRQLEHAVPARDVQAVRVHGAAQELGPPERRVPEPAREQRQRRRVGGRRCHRRVRRAARAAPLLRALHQRRRDPQPPAQRSAVNVSGLPAFKPCGSCLENRAPVDSGQPAGAVGPRRWTRVGPPRGARLGEQRKCVGVEPKNGGFGALRLRMHPPHEVEMNELEGKKKNEAN
jgi:hypothetical protein